VSGAGAAWVDARKEPSRHCRPRTFRERNVTISPSVTV
jgi:hypothetical protein